MARQNNQPGPYARHVHHSYIWLGSIRAVASIMLALAVAMLGQVASFAASLQGGAAPIVLTIVVTIAVLGAVLAIVALVVAFQAWSYRHLYYEIGAEEFSVYSGIFNKKRMHIPYQRVQSVGHKASLLQRLAGVCTVEIDTAGGAANDGAVIPYVTNADAEMLRRELFARKQAVLSGVIIAAGQSAVAAMEAGRAQSATAPSAGNVLDGAAELLDDVRGIWGGGALDTGRVVYEHGLTNKELALSAATNNTSFAIVALGLLGALAQVAGIAVELLGARTDDVARAVSGIGLGGIVATAVASFLGVIVVLWAVSLAGSCLVYGGFRARRRDTRIEVEYGLLTRKFHGVDVDRVQSVIIKQGFFRRLFGYCEISLGKIDTASHDGSDSKEANAKLGLIVHPFVKLDRVPEILAGLVPEFSDVPDRVRPVAPVALRRALIRRCTWQGSGMWIAVVSAIGQALFNAAVADAGIDVASVRWVDLANTAFVGLYVLALACLALDAVGAVLWHRDSSFAFNQGFMQVSNGGLSRESVMFPRKKIQYAAVRTNPFQRAACVATVIVRTASGLGTTVRLLDVREEDAAVWYEWMHPGGASLQ